MLRHTACNREGGKQRRLPGFMCQIEVNLSVRFQLGETAASVPPQMRGWQNSKP